MQIIAAVFLGLVAIGTQATGSPFNTYDTFLDKAQMRGGCSVSDSKAFRNRGYQFRGRRRGEGPLVLHDGKALELNELGTREWETELLQQSVVAIGGQSAVMLRFISIHVGGTGSWGNALIVTCDDRQLTVVFEAEGHGLRDIAVTKDGVVVVKRYVWSTSDGHCCPSGEAEERYRWDRRSRRFVHMSAAPTRRVG